MDFLLVFIAGNLLLTFFGAVLLSIAFFIAAFLAEFRKPEFRDMLFKIFLLIVCSWFIGLILSLFFGQVLK